MVEKQKPAEIMPEAMETDSAPLDVQLPDVDKMAAGGGVGGSSSDNGEEKPLPDGVAQGDMAVDDGEPKKGATEPKDEAEPKEGAESNGPGSGDNASNDDGSPPTEKKTVSC